MSPPPTWTKEQGTTIPVCPVARGIWTDRTKLDESSRVRVGNENCQQCFSSGTSVIAPEGLIACEGGLGVYQQWKGQWHSEL